MVLKNGTAGNDSLTGTSSNDTINGLDGNDTINGLAGNDVISGGAGINNLIGGLGDDTYLLSDSETSTLVEAANQGSDTIKLIANAGAFTLNTLSLTNYTEIENLDASDITATNMTLTGNGVANILTGGSANDTLLGGAGNDTLIGGAGNDFLQGDTGTNLLNGGDGDDTYIISGSETSTITDSSGTDTVKLTAGAFAPGSYTLGNTIENLDASAVTSTTFTLTGNALNNTITGGSGNDSISGGAGNDTIIGGAGNDTIVGGAGTNSLVGGVGNDTYLVDGAEIAVINEGSSEGTDTVKLIANAGAFAAGAFILGSNIEILDASAITVTNLTLTGNSSNNVITGGSANDAIDGGAGDDNIYGGSGNDTLIGGAGNDYLDGGAGTNDLQGGDGNDTYVITGSSTNTITETTGIDTVMLTGGTFAPGSYTLENLLENLNAQNITSTNLTLTGNALDNTITGGYGNDSISGGAGNDTLYGYYGNDTISGGAGTNNLLGGYGNDTYLVDGAETTTVTEYTNEGTDTVKLQATGGAFAPGSYTIATNIENLDASAITSTNLALTGNSGDNTITGGAGDDTLRGGTGNDQLIGGAGNDYLQGEDGDDFLTGGTGNNTLNGGAGNDTYTVSDTETSTIIDSGGTDTIKLAATAGAFSGGTYSIAAYASIENLDASAITATNLTLTGSDADNVINGGSLNDYIVGGIGNDTIYGNSGNDTLQGDAGTNYLSGGTGNDTYLVGGNENTTIYEASYQGTDTVKLTGTTYTPGAYTLSNNVENLNASAVTSTNLNLTGNTLDNVITGGALNDTITGGSGNNTLIGGLGNDTYLVSGNETTTIQESGAEGTDTIKLTAVAGAFASGAYTMGNNVEILDATAVTATNLKLTGNGSNNTIIGGSANDSIDGGTGADTMTGGLGNDTYTIDNANDLIIETPNGGNDTVKNNIAGVTVDAVGNYTNIGIEIENLDFYDSSEDLTLTGDDVGNMLTGGTGNDVIYGLDGDDSLYGSRGNNTLEGGVGNDAYLIDGYETSTTIVETSGTDAVKLVALPNASGVFRYGSFTLENSIYAAIENLDASDLTSGLTLKGSGSNNVVTGGSGNDYIMGYDTNSLTPGQDTLIGGAGNDTIVGGSDIDSIDGGIGNDSISGQEGNDFLFGGDGNDVLHGDLGNDNLSGDAGNDVLYGEDGDDILNGGAGNDYLYGGEGNDSLYGNDGDDVLVGSAGTNGLYGGAGNDTYMITGTETSTVIELEGEGIDTIKLVATAEGTFEPKLYTLGNWMDNLDGSNVTLTSLTLTGNELDNYIIGGGVSDFLVGGLGNDTLDGGADGMKDILYGGEGSDCYVIHDMKDTINESGLGVNDKDTIKLAADFDDNKDTAETATYNLSNTKIEVLDGSLSSLNLTLANNVKTSTTIIGGSGNDSLRGGSAKDSLVGGAGDDVLFGGNDLLSDTLNGGLGDDTYVIIDTSDSITDGFGSNTIQLSGAFAKTGFNLSEQNYSAANITTLDASVLKKGYTLTTADINTTILGSKGKDIIIGLSGNDVLYGNEGNDSIYGGAGSNTLYGGVGNDTLVADATGTNHLDGGLGNDLYILNGNGNNVTIEDEKGVDTIKLTANGMANYTLNAGIEVLDASSLTVGMNIYGNDLMNTIKGSSGNDYINGGKSADAMTGGAGNDTYVVDCFKDKTTEAINAGTDTVIIKDYDVSTNKSFTLGLNIENLDLTNLSLDLDKDGTYDENDEDENKARVSLAAGKISIRGNKSDNIITISNTYGDCIKVSADAGNDTIYGSTKNDIIDGGAGNDAIYGGKGNDMLTGGLGNDVFYFFEGDGKDFISATDALDVINIDASTLLDTSEDFLFYTDKAGNLYIDYSNDEIGKDVIELNKTKFNNSTTIKIGDETINVGLIIQNLGSFKSATADAIALFDVDDKAAQAITLAGKGGNWNIG